MAPRTHHHRNRPTGEDAAHAKRRAQALDLRIAGASYRQIGAQLAVSQRTAYYDVQRELGALDTASAKKAERLRDLEARRLDALQLALTAGIRAGNPGAVVAAVRIMERRARLFGLEIERHEHSGPGGGPMRYVDEFHPPAKPEEPTP